MTPEQWLAAAVSCGVCVVLTVLLMQVVRKYDTTNALRSVRLLIVLAATVVGTFVVYFAGAFPANHLPLQITATFTIAVLFHSWVLHLIEKGTKAAERKVDGVKGKE